MHIYKNISFFFIDKFLYVQYINDEIQNEIKYQYNFEQTENNVTLIWNRTIDICAYMFILCPDIIEIDLSNFNASQVVTMTYMFGFCYSLTSINLTNFVTSKVTKMNRMFEKCHSLNSVDV